MNQDTEKQDKESSDESFEIVDMANVGRNRDRDRERDRECDNCGSHRAPESSDTEEFVL